MTATLARRSAPGGYAAPRHESWWPDLLGTGAVLTTLAVVALWVRGRGVQDLGGLATGLSSLGRLTGLVAADLLLVQVLLMARVPWVERTYGQDRLARWHRLTGFTSFNLMLAHVVLITVGYAASTGTGVVAETWDLVTTYPGMLLATAAVACLVLVVATSVKAARRRLRYESWHLLHLYAYLGVGLALPHELWTGTDFVGSGLARAYWWTFYGVAAGSALLFRLGLPAWRSLRHRLAVAAVVREAPGVISVYLRGRALHRLPARAGQFFVWRFLDGPGWSRGNPYSLSAAPNTSWLRLTVKDLGDGSSRLGGLRAGTKVLVEGPYGRLTRAAARTHRVTLIACGVGITPLRALLDEVPEAVLLYRARTPRDLVFRAELDRRPGLRVAYLLGPRGVSWLPAGYPPDSLSRMVPDIVDTDVYICGPEAWMRAVAEDVRAAGVPDEQVHLEHFTW